MKKHARMRIDGAMYELHPWIVVEEREDGIPIKLHLAQEYEQLGDAAAAAGVQDKNIKMHLLWTPMKWLRKGH